MRLAKAFNRWLKESSEDAGDSQLELAESAFYAGWHAARPPIKGTSDGHMTHNGDNRPGHLKFRLHGETDDGTRIELTIDEPAARAMLRTFGITAVGLDHPNAQAIIEEG